MMRYAIVKLDTEEIVARFSALPASFEVLVDGRRRRIVAPVQVGDEGLGHRFVDLVEVNFDRPGPYYSPAGDTAELDGNTVTETRAWRQWTQQEIDAYEAARLEDIASQLDRGEEILRATVLLLMDELNLHSQRLQEVLAAGSQASSLADFRARMTAIQPIPQRTVAQLRAAIKAKLQ